MEYDFCTEDCPSHIPCPLEIGFISDYIFFFQPTSYVAHLIGHEGSGSLLSYLRANGWCNMLGAGPGEGAKGFGFFTVTVDLTKEGEGEGGGGEGE